MLADGSRRKYSYMEKVATMAMRPFYTTATASRAYATQVWGDVGGALKSTALQDDTQPKCLRAKALRRS